MAVWRIKLSAQKRRGDLGFGHQVFLPLFLDFVACGMIVRGKKAAPERRRLFRFGGLNSIRGRRRGGSG